MPRPPQPRPTSGPPKLHGEDAVALEADVADLHFLARELLLGGGLDDGGAGLAAEEEGGRVALGIAADQQHALALLGHHVGEVGEREALADAALAIDGDDLGFLLHRSRVHGVERLIRLLAELRIAGECEVDAVHARSLQSRAILMQDGSVKAVW
jgi:hypothetical protein